MGEEGWKGGRRGERDRQPVKRRTSGGSGSPSRSHPPQGPSARFSQNTTNARFFTPTIIYYSHVTPIHNARRSGEEGTARAHLLVMVCRLGNRPRFLPFHGPEKRASALHTEVLIYPRVYMLYLRPQLSTKVSQVEATKSNISFTALSLFQARLRREERRGRL